MNELENKILEEEKRDETLPSEPEKEQTELNSNAVPTPEQVEEAGLEPEAEPEAEPASEAKPEPESEDFVESIDGENEDFMTEEQKSVEKMLTQSQVDELIGRTRVETRDKTRNDTLNDIYSRYGVNDETGLDEAVGKSQKYDLLREDYDAIKNQLKEVQIKLAMYDSGIDPERYEDARLILTGKQLDITPENIQSELATHPEWKKTLPSLDEPGAEVEKVFKKAEPIMPESRISVLGNDKPEVEQSGISERESALKMFH